VKNEVDKGATIYTTLSVDGKKIFTYLPDTGEKLQAGMEGSLSDPVFLKAGAHRLNVEQVMFSNVDNYNHALRLLWQKPHGAKETLPLEFLSPGGRKAAGKKAEDMGLNPSAPNTGKRS
jgi:hypothetical protein